MTRVMAWYNCPMRSIVSLALLLGACSFSSPSMTVPGSLDSRAYSGVSQAPDMEANGLSKRTYDFSMNLVPCMKYTGNAHIPMTMDERMQYRQENGGYLSDCGVVDDWHVWG